MYVTMTRCARTHPHRVTVVDILFGYIGQDHADRLLSPRQGTAHRVRETVLGPVSECRCAVARYGLAGCVGSRSLGESQPASGCLVGRAVDDVFPGRERR